MDDIVTGVQISELPDSHAVTPGEEALYPELVIAVKDLMVSVYGYPQVMIRETLVKVEEERSEGRRRVRLRKDLLQTLLLHLALGDDEIVIALLRV